MLFNSHQTIVIGEVLLAKRAQLKAMAEALLAERAQLPEDPGKPGPNNTPSHHQTDYCRGYCAGVACTNLAWATFIFELILLTIIGLTMR